MTAISVLFCLAYISGLLLTGFSEEIFSLPVGAIAFLISSVITASVFPRFWRTGPRSKMWLMAGMVGFLSVLYFQTRLPQPAQNDISRLLPSADTSAQIATLQVQGLIDSPPRLTRSQRIQFQLRATGVRSASQNSEAGSSFQPINGKVYVTVPLLQGTGLHPGQFVSVTGTLYRPKSATNPGGFNFEAYLRQQGIFAGLSGKQVNVALAGEQSTLPHRLTLMPSWIETLRGTAQHRLWQVRQRIVKAQVQGLGVPEGPLLSAMVLGKNAVDVPFDLRDQFTQVGLAHALAASGFQVSLLIAVVLSLTQRSPNATRLGLGIGVIALYIALTGMQPAVLRAGIMGLAVLLGLTTERKVRPLNSLLLAATLLLLANPLWIWDLGFQFSFLATLGLLVTVPVLTQWLDWMPAAIAPLIAVPLAAYLWTLPLQLHVFGVVSPYSIPINILTTFLITIVSIGGVISAVAASVYPPAGSGLAWLLYYPTTGLIKMAEFGSELPGNSLAVGTITVVQVLIIYGLFGLIWWQSWWHRRWWLAGILGISLVAVPVWYSSAHLFQVTVLDTSNNPVLVIQDKSNIGIISSSNEAEVKFTLQPFLKQRGINQINWAIAPNSQIPDFLGWLRLLRDIPIRALYGNVGSQQPTETSNPNSISTALQLHQRVVHALQAHRGQYLTIAVNQTTNIGSIPAQLMQANPPVLRFQIKDQSWLLLKHVSPQEQKMLVDQKRLPTAEVLWWSGEELIPAVLEAVKPRVAIASARFIPKTDATWFRQQKVTTYATGQDGAIQWTPEKGFMTTLGERGER
jgi:competence protein ComEC